MGLHARDHVTSALAGLHWLPILYRIQYQVALTIFFIYTNQRPPKRTKLSDDHSRLLVSLPETVHAVPDKMAFKRVLKTHLFNVAFHSSSTLATL